MYVNKTQDQRSQPAEPTLAILFQLATAVAAGCRWYYVNINNFIFLINKTSLVYQVPGMKYWYLVPGTYEYEVPPGTSKYKKRYDNCFHCRYHTATFTLAERTATTTTATATTSTTGRQKRSGGGNKSDQPLTKPVVPDKEIPFCFVLKDRRQETGHKTQMINDLITQKKKRSAGK